MSEARAFLARFKFKPDDEITPREWALVAAVLEAEGAEPMAADRLEYFLPDGSSVYLSERVPIPGDSIEAAIREDRAPDMLQRPAPLICITNEGDR